MKKRIIISYAGVCLYIFKLVLRFEELIRMIYLIKLEIMCIKDQILKWSE